MIAQLKRSKPAYEAYDEGVKRWINSRQKHSSWPTRAISIESGEGLFTVCAATPYNLKELNKARTAYDQAIRLNPGFFRPYLDTRGGQSSAGRRTRRSQRSAEKSTAAAHGGCPLLSWADSPDRR